MTATVMMTFVSANLVRNLVRYTFSVTVRTSRHLRDLMLFEGEVPAGFPHTAEQAAHWVMTIQEVRSYLWRGWA